MKTNPKILLCALNSKFIHSCLAVHSLKKYAITRGYPKEKIIIKEFTINDTLDYIIENICSANVGIIGFSVYIWNCEYISKLCNLIKQIKPDMQILLGGPEVSYIQNHPFFEEGTFDFIIKGEGEKTFFNFLKTGEISQEEIIDLNEIPFAYDEENISLFENRIVYYETSRGCPFSCAYCLSSAEKGVRFLTLDRVKEELTFFASHGVKQVKFVDRTFNADKSRACAIWSFIIENFSNTDMNFHFEIAADLLDDKLISLLSTAPPGLIQLEIGIQSTNEKTLSVSCRKTNTEQVLNNTKKLILPGNINIHTDLIAGLPGESIQHFKKSFNDVYNLNSHQLQLGFLKLLHGTEMENISKNYNYIFSPFSPYEVIANEDLSHSDILSLKKFEDVFERFYNSQRFILSLKMLETFFENPFIMFQKISEFFEEKNLSFVSVSTKELYNLLHKFFEKHIDADIRPFDKLLLCDFYFSEKSELVPTELRYLLLSNKISTQKSSAILHLLGLQKERGLVVRFVGEDSYIVDYSKRNKINGRFEYKFYSSEISEI